MKAAALLALAALVAVLPSTSAADEPDLGAGCHMTHDWPPSQFGCSAAGISADCNPLLRFSPDTGASCTVTGVKHCVRPWGVEAQEFRVGGDSSCNAQVWI